MDELTIELSDEAREELVRMVADLARRINEVYDILMEIAKAWTEKIRAIMDDLARFFLKMQLLEWKLPLPAVEFISRKLYWYWAWNIGFRWYCRKLALIE